MRSGSRVLRLAIQLARRSRGRTFMMMLMLAFGLTLFLVTSALATSSRQGLSAAVDDVAGPTTLVTLDFPSLPSQSAHEASAHIHQTLRAQPAVSFAVLEPFVGVDTRCPHTPDTTGTGSGGAKEADHTRQLYAMVSGSPAPAPVELPERDRPGAPPTLCLDGMAVPDVALSPPPSAVAYATKEAVIVHPLYVPLARASVPTERASDATWRVYAWSPHERPDLIGVLTNACVSATASARGVDGMPASVCLPSVPASNESIRRASEGVEVMYRLLSAAILLLGATGILVAESIIVRDRRWLYGLSRAYGARRRDIAALVILDVGIILTGAAALTALLVLAGHRWIAETTESLFNQPVILINGPDLAYLALGCIAVLTIACGPPVLNAVRSDPLDILERRE